MLPTQACTSHTSPQGCFVHHWNVHVECCLQLHPIRTMHTGPIHKVPAYAHWPNSHFPHGQCTIMCPPYTLSIDILSIFPHPGAATHVLNPVTFLHLDIPSILASHLGGPFHHLAALVAPIFLWVGYPLGTHHTLFPPFQLCAYMRTHSGQPGPHPGSMPTCAPFCAPPHTLHAIFSWVFLTPTPLPVPWHTSISIPWPMGREILLSGQDSNLSSLGAYEGLALRGG